jgi:hypothetical protein
MGYFVRKSGKGWKLCHKVGDGKHRIVPKRSAEFHDLGLRREMDLAEAQTKIKPVQAERRVEWNNERQVRAALRVQKARDIAGAWLPDELVHEFETRYLAKAKAGKKPFIWSMAKRIIAELPFPPQEWGIWSHDIYAFFAKWGKSKDTAQRVASLMNTYGHLYCVRKNLPYQQIGRIPNGKEIDEAFGRLGTSRKTPPLTHAQLQVARARLPEAQGNWLFVSFWLGLRGKEVDLLRDSKWAVRFRPYVHKRFKWVAELWMPKVEKWKGLPLVFPEQVAAKKLIESGAELKRPQIKTMAKKLETKMYVRSGRRGFSEFLKESGYNRECRQAWLGHVDKSTLGQHYDDTRIPVYFEPDRRELSTQTSDGHK